MNDFDTRVSHTQLTLEHIASTYHPAVFASSLAAEDMVLTDLIYRSALPIQIFTLDTGRLHAETFSMLTRIEQYYGYSIAVYRPEPNAVHTYVETHGVNAFYESIDLRRTCCHIRKVEPLKRALKNSQAWITGQRRGQSNTRAILELQQHDDFHGITKFNPLTDWSEQEIWHYIHTHNVPYNLLHDKGYPSIGCEPCTRAIQPHEDVRAGRWWWEHSDSKECGLHQVNGNIISPPKNPPHKEK